ncbi:MAG: ASKHA domain-containing protein [Treponema sp.]|nr:ASKHA domain-containing protein [Treponema sp.]
MNSENNFSINNSSAGGITASAAIDIGTTTVQAQLVNDDTSEIIDSISVLNEQRIFGADVISRISAAQYGKLDDLFTVINNQVDSILRHFIAEHNLSGIEKCAVSGNTTMLHLFCRADPSAMGAAPFTPFFLEQRIFSGSDLSLPVNEIILLPGISAFVGADVTAGLAYLDIINKNEDALFIDIGTNGEIAVWKKNEKRLFCCSAAAGPCFEEAEISCGLSAADFINIIAMMKKHNIIDETGALADDFMQDGFPVYFFAEYSADNQFNGKVITQKDVRGFQLAKSAIFSGIKMLCKTAHILPLNIERAYIAGGIGERLNLESAAITGLLPSEITGRANVCGNTSLKGAVKSLTDPSFLSRCGDVVSCAETVELAHSKYFSAAFAHNMWFN